MRHNAERVLGGPAKLKGGNQPPSPSLDEAAVSQPGDSFGTGGPAIPTLPRSSIRAGPMGLRVALIASVGSVAVPAAELPEIFGELQ